MYDQHPVSDDTLLRDTFWSFEGRLSREQYRDHHYSAAGMGVSLILIIGLVLIIVLTPISPSIPIFFGATCLAWLMQLSVNIRRAHDINLSSKWVIIPFLGFFGGMLLFSVLPIALGMVAMAIGTIHLFVASLISMALFYATGNLNANQYGPPPLENT